MIVASSQFSLSSLHEPDEFWRRFRLQVQQARDQGAEIVLFPEYFSLAWLLAAGGKFADRLSAAGDLESRFLEEVRRAVAEFRIGVVAGTYPRVEAPGSIRNRCWIFLPGKEPLFQDKVNMTRFEAEEWRIQGGEPELRLFRHAGALCAVAICYDVEFPAYCAAAAEAKVDVLFVPSCTDDVHGYWRVRHCAEARAVENQCFVVLSSVVEGDDRYPEIGAHYGRATVLTPCDTGFPEAGILAEGRANVGDLVVARLELRALEEVRRNGTVLNLRDSRGGRRITWRE